MRDTENPKPKDSSEGQDPSAQLSVGPPEPRKVSSSYPPDSPEGRMEREERRLRWGMDGFVS